MKKSIIILSVAALAAAFSMVSCNQNGTSDNGTGAQSDSTAVAKVPYNSQIVFYNIDRISDEYDMAHDLTSALETKVKGIQNEITRRENNLKAEMNSFQQKYEKGLLTRTVAEEQGAKLQKKQSDYQAFAMRKQEEIAEEQAVTMRQIFDAINTYIQKFNDEHHYSMIIATSSAAQGDLLSVPVSAADPALDITDALLKGLNEEYVKSKDKAAPADSTKTK
jgi:outer membrane protein